MTILTPKKGNTVNCADYGNPILISYASTKLIKILSKHLEAKTEIFINKTTFSFRKGCGTRQATAVMRDLCVCSDVCA